VTLSAKVWLLVSAKDVPLPAVLEMLPYRKRDSTAARDATTHAQLSQHGYVCLRVDLRGCGESDGLFDDEYSEQELCDIEDAISWIADQPWCSGAVGMMGISWGGFNSLQVAARQPPALKAVISLCSSVDRFHDDIHYKGGCQLAENIGWAATAMSWMSMPPDPALVGSDWRDTWLYRLENTPFLISDWLRHASRDAYWCHGSVCEDMSKIEAAVLSISGWHDGYRNTSAKLLEGGTSGPVKAIVGPWNHKYPHIASPEPRMNFLSEALRWWDRWLKNVPNGVEDDPDYRVYVMDGIAPDTSYSHRPGQWIGLPQWPAPQIETRNFAFDVSAKVASHPLCGQKFGEFFPFGFGPGELPDDQQSDDALSTCFDSAPLAETYTVIGAGVLRCKVVSDKPYGQMVARLCDVAPDGASTLICLGILNLAFREGFETPDALTSGMVYDVSVQLDQAAYSVPKGHRIRLAVSASYWPFIWPEPGAVELTLSEVQLELPQLVDAAGLGWDCPPVPPNAQHPVTQTIGATETKELQVQDGVHQLIIAADHGETEHLDHGLKTTSAVREVWSIDEADITTAKAEITWDRSIFREDFAAATRVETVMYTDDHSFYVMVNFQAFDGKRCIFRRSFYDSIDRKMPRHPK
ncbi:MAG: CocE/NonD family hydrolase, partial [Yoonia sp.]|uniref:CocE/NonD family hydrolase n=1 Tax=Yoonia sp. TaxID=2212373 RepID=UPI003EF25B0D